MSQKQKKYFKEISNRTALFASLAVVFLLIAFAHLPSIVSRGAGTINISGSVIDASGSVPLVGKTVRVSVNSVDTELTAETNGSGAFTISNVTSNAGDIITVFLDDEEEKGVLVTKSNGVDITGSVIYQDGLNISQENGSAVTNTDLDNADDGDGGEDINDIDAIYYVMEGELVTQDGKNLIITAGKTYTPGGGMNIRGNIANLGIFNGEGNDMFIGGNLIVYPGATWNHSGAITMNGDANQYLDQGSNPINSWFIIFNEMSPVTLLTNDFNASDLVINNGCTFQTGGRNVTVNQDFINEGTFRLIGTETLDLTQSTESGTFEYTGNTDEVEDTISLIDFGETDYFNLVINSSVGTPDIYEPTSTLSVANLTVLGGTLDLNEQETNIFGDLNIYEEGTLAATAATINITGDWYNDGGGTFDPSTSTINLTGTGQNLYGSSEFYNLSKVDTTNDSSPNNLNLESGTITTITNSLTLDGLDDDDRVFLGSNNPETSFTINFTGSSTFTGDYLSISDSTITDNSTGIELPINPENSIDDSNNSGWFNVVDETAPELTLISEVTTPSYNRNPTFTFQSNEAGTFALNGSCFTTTTASVDAEVNKTIILAKDELGNGFDIGEYEGCSVVVTDAAENASTPLSINGFSIENQKNNSPTSTAPIVNYVTLKPSAEQPHILEIAFSVLDLDQEEPISARLEYLTPENNEWNALEVKIADNDATSEMLDVVNSDYYQIKNINAVELNEIKVIWDTANLGSTEPTNVEVKVIPFDGTLTGEYMVAYTDVAPPSDSSDNKKRSSSEDIIINPEETEETISTSEDNDVNPKEEVDKTTGGDEIILEEAIDTEEATEEEATSSGSDNTEEKLGEMVRQKVETELEKITQGLQEIIANNDVIKSMVESVIINSQKTAEETENETPVDIKSLETVIITRSTTASETVDLIPQAKDLLTSKGPNLHLSDETLNIKNILKYDNNRSLRFTDIGRFNPLYNKVQILKNSYLDILGQKQYVLNGDIQSFNTDGTTKLKPKEAVTRKNWAQMLMISHGLPAYSIGQLPEVRFDGSPMPTFNDLPKEKVDDNNTTDIIYSAAYYGLIEGTGEGNAEINRAVTVEEGVKMLIRVGEFAQGTTYKEIPQWVHINIPREGWFFSYYAKAAGQLLFGQILDNPDRLETDLTNEEAIDVLFDTLIKREMYDENGQTADSLRLIGLK